MPDVAGQPHAGSLAEVRNAINRLDRDIVRAMAARGTCVKQAARFKASRADVEAPHRVEQVVASVRALASDLGLAPRVAEAAYRAMIAEFIVVEHKVFALRPRPGATVPEIPDPWCGEP